MQALPPWRTAVDKTNQKSYHGAGHASLKIIPHQPEGKKVELRQRLKAGPESTMTYRTLDRYPSMDIYSLNAPQHYSPISTPLPIVTFHFQLKQRHSVGIKATLASKSPYPNLWWRLPTWLEVTPAARNPGHNTRGPKRIQTKNNSNKDKLRNQHLDV